MANNEDTLDSTETKDMLQYVSCMKINGVPLLPPMMTQEYSQEMQYYKRLAQAVEKRISDLKVCLEDSTLYSNNHPSDTEECFDGTNISYDPQDRSSFSERQSSQTEQDNSEAGKLDDFFENNDFESMNSQVTIIDMSSDQNNISQTESTDMSYIKMNINDSKPSDNKALEFYKNLQSQDDHLPTLPSQVIRSEGNKFTSPSKIAPNKIEDEKRDSEKVTAKYQIQKIVNITKSQSKETSKAGLDNSSSRINTKKNVAYNSPLRTKRTMLHKKENISPIVISKKIITKSKDLSMYEPKKPLIKKGVQTIRHKLSPAKNITGSLNNISSGLASPPRLVRQNSYTLDSPSPLLLAHLEVRSITSGIDVGSISMSDTSKDMSPVNVPNKNTSKTDYKLFDEKLLSEFKLSSKVIPSNIHNKKPNDSLKSASNMSSTEQIDANWDNYNRLHQISAPSIQRSPVVNVNELSALNSDYPIQNEFENKLVSNGIEIMSDMNSKESPGVYFDVILRKFQEDHEKQMSTLLKKQQEEQLMLRKTFENQQKQLMDQFQTTFASNSRESSRKSHSPQVKNFNIKESPRLSKELSNDDSMEKYLTISADVLNASRSLLINRKTVNLSPTDIQCVNVVPTQDLTPSDRNSGYHSKDSSLRTVYNRNDHSLNGSFDLMLENNSKLFSQRHRNDTTLESNKSYDFYDRGDEPLDTARSGNTLDDLNFTFSSDDGAHVNSYFSEGRRDDVMTKARNKLSEIQKNLSSQALGKRSVRSHSVTSHNFISDQTVSLSSIDVLPNRDFPRNFADRNHLSLNLSEINQPSCVFKSTQEMEKEMNAATKIVSCCKGYLTRRLMKTERVESTVQTIKDALMCALQMHTDQDTIQGPDIDLHRRLIQQITAACYTLHDIFIDSTPDERMRLIRQDRERKLTIMQRSFSLSSSSPHHRQLSATTQRVLRRKMDAMSRSHSGAFTSRSSRSSHYPANVMTRSHYEQSDHMRGLTSSKVCSGTRRTLSVSGDGASRKPWR